MLLSLDFDQPFHNLSCFAYGFFFASNLTVMHNDFSINNHRVNRFAVSGIYQIADGLTIGNKREIVKIKQHQIGKMSRGNNASIDTQCTISVKGAHL